MPRQHWPAVRRKKKLRTVCIVSRKSNGSKWKFVSFFSAILINFYCTQQQKKYKENTVRTNFTNNNNNNKILKSRKYKWLRFAMRSLDKIQHICITKIKSWTFEFKSLCNLLCFFFDVSISDFLHV